MDGTQRGVWERIAGGFDRTRRSPWPFVVAFLASLPPGSRVLDLMGGNGRHARAALDAGHACAWLDWSRNLAEAARRRVPGARLVVGDAVRLPFRDGAFDACLYVAGLHGLEAPEARRASLAELRRVLRPGGAALVSVWSRDAPRFRAAGPPGEPADVRVPWRAENAHESRFYHLYTIQELAADLKEAGLRAGPGNTGRPVSLEGENLVARVRRETVAAHGMSQE